MLNVKLNRDPITRTASIVAAVVLVAVTVFVAGFGVSAQGQFATLSGTVLDQNSRPISGARLVLSNAAAQTKNEVKTDASGRYEFVGVPAGAYELNFESIGMAYLKREGLNVTPGQAVEVNAVMRIGSVMETITVVPGGPESRPTVNGYSGARPADDKPDPCAQSTVGACIRPPVKTKDVRPIYPNGAAGGVVILDATIDANGLISNTQVLRTPDPALSTAAMEAVNRWEFRPTHLDGQPIDTHMTVTVNFVAAK